MKIRARYASARTVNMARARRQGRGKMLSSSRFAKNTKVNQTGSASGQNKTQRTQKTRQTENFEEMQKNANDLQKKISSLFDVCKKLGEEQEKKVEENAVEKKNQIVQDVKKEIVSCAKEIVNEYQELMENLENANTNTCTVFGNHLKTLMKSYEKELKQAGISVNRKGTLTIDEKEALNASDSAIQSVFGKSTGVFGQLKEKCGSIENNAATTIQVLNRMYGTSSIYSKYGINTAYYGKSGSAYSAWG